MKAGAEKLGDGMCIECGATVGLKKGWVMRRHVSAKQPPTRARADRICPSGGTGNWAPFDRATQRAAVLAWGEDGPPGGHEMSAAEREHYLSVLAMWRAQEKP